MEHAAIWTLPLSYIQAGALRLPGELSPYLPGSGQRIVVRDKKSGKTYEGIVRGCRIDRLT